MLLGLKRFIQNELVIQWSLGRLHFRSIVIFPPCVMYHNFGSPGKFVSAMEDSEARISLVHNDVVQDLDLPVSGKLKIRDAVCGS